MADHRRFELFARWITREFQAPRIFDVAGGMGRLNAELTRLGRQCTTFDLRHKRLDVPYAQRIFTLDEPCEADLVVGMHPDGATRVVIEYAARHRLPFAVVPCCSDNGLPYRSWMKHLREQALELGLQPAEAQLPIRGRSQILYGFPPYAVS